MKVKRISPPEQDTNLSLRSPTIKGKETVGARSPRRSCRPTSAPRVTVPPQADSGWIGEAGPGPSYLDPDGAVLTLIDRDEMMTHPEFRSKLEAIGFGAFIPAEAALGALLTVIL